MSELTDAATALLEHIDESIQVAGFVQTPTHPTVERLRAALAADAQRSNGQEERIRELEWQLSTEQAAHGQDTHIRRRLEEEFEKVRNALQGTGYEYCEGYDAPILELIQDLERLRLAAQKVVRDWPVVQQATKGTRLPHLEQYIYELRDALEGKVSQVDWRARAVAHARALVSVLVLKEQILAGTFGEQWLKEARETVDLDLQEYTFAAGYAAANKDGTLKGEHHV